MSRHLTSEEISAWIVGDRDPQAESHLTGCAHCSAAIGRLELAFWQFRDSGLRWSAYWQAAPPSPRPRAVPLWRKLAATGTLAAAALALLLLVRTPVPANAEAPFLAIPYVAPLAPYEQTRVLRMELPVTALIASGFEVHAPEPGGALTVDVLVGQDGRAHAIRPISRSEIQ